MKVSALERTTRRALLAVPLVCALVCTAGCEDVPTLLPPPFGPKPGAAPRLFFPSGLTVAPQVTIDGGVVGGQVLVANGNFDHAFTGGTVVSLDPSYIESFFNAAPVDPTDPSLPVPVDIPASAFLGVARIGNYAGPLVVDISSVDLDGGTTDGGVGVINAFTGSRDTSILNAVTLDPTTGALTCLTGSNPITGIDGGVIGDDCYGGILDTGAAFDLLGPYAIASGVTRLPGATSDSRALFVSPLIPYIDGTISNTVYTSAPLAALDPDNPTQALWYGNISSYTVAGGIGGGPMVFDAQRRKLVLGGCYQRFTGQNVGDPSSGKCTTGTTTSNLIRLIGVDEGDNPNVDTIDIATEVSSIDTEDLTLGNYDPVTGFAQTLFAITRTPDTLVEIGLSQDPSAQILVTRATSMPISPANMLRLQRPPDAPGPDLIAVTLESSQSLDVYDSSVGEVVGQIENLGVAPAALAQLPVHAGDTTARLVVNVFQECRVALIDINFARPWEVRLRGRLGSCPVAPQ